MQTETPTAPVLDRQEVRAHILKLREAIRGSRDPRGQNRCWLNDRLLDRLSTIERPENLADPLPHERMARCEHFYWQCNASKHDPWPKSFVIEPEHWDDDLAGHEVNLVGIWVATQKAVDRFCAIPPVARRTEHYRQLYAILPEKLPADFRLHSYDRFIKRSGNPRESCPNFWTSHSLCGAACDLSRWGPCPETSATAETR